MGKLVKFAAACVAVLGAFGVKAAPVEFMEEFTSIVYADAENGSDTNGDGSEQKPYATLQKALSVAADGSAILLQDGTYLMDDPFTTISRPITVKSVNGPENCALTKGATCADQNKRGIIELNHDDAVVDGITLRNGYLYARSPGSPVMITKGLVRNCIIRDNQGGSDGYGNHGGVTVQGGTLRDCVVRGNCAAYNNNGLGNGGGVYLSSGLVENCVTTNNGAGGSGGGVYVTGADSVLRNCLVGFNHGLPMSSPTTKNKLGGGIYVAGASVRVVNSVFFNNGGDMKSEIGLVNGDCFSCCASSVDNEECATWQVIDESAFRNWSRLSSAPASTR